MNRQVSLKEVEAVAARPAAVRYGYFVKQVADWEAVWSLRGAGGWVLAAAEEQRECVPVWPHAAFAAQCAGGEWAESEPAAIPLREWLDRWVPGMERDGRAVAVMPTREDRGVVVAAERLAADLRVELGRLE